MEILEENTESFKIAGVIFGIVGALIIALNVGKNDVAYCFMLFGAIFSSLNFYFKKDKANLFLFLFYVGLNIMGLFNYSK